MEPQNKTSGTSFRCTPEQLAQIDRSARECGMSRSAFIISRALGYRPKARLTPDQESGLKNLIGCRADFLKYLGAMKGMRKTELQAMLNSIPGMAQWANGLAVLADEVSAFVSSVKKSNAIP